VSGFFVNLALGAALAAISVISFFAAGLARERPPRIAPINSQAPEAAS
jgi:hypothetical protein